MAAQRVKLFGAHAEDLADALKRYGDFERVDVDPEVVVCYGGDGTLLSAEAMWPGVPKVPIRNSRRGHRMIKEPPEDVFERLANGTVEEHRYMKLDCRVEFAEQRSATMLETVMNECNVHMAQINSSVRFELWIDDEPYEDGLEIVGDGFVICTPFGSTAYYNQITRGVFLKGIGIAFKYTSEHTNHIVVPADTEVRVRIRRGPAVLAFDNKPEHTNLTEGDEITTTRHDGEAVIWR